MMAVKTITITVEAHEKLMKHKQKGESFTDVINRVFGGTPTLELAGVLTPEQGDAISRDVKTLRRDLDQKARRRQSQRRQ
jgi:predicted CopG family antitoxin